ncbi:MAG: hypothetical protein KBF70_09130 [Moraxellaceae bacterium]|nr:hypothetical protein [Moraxellaceae bacterium]
MDMTLVGFDRESLVQYVARQIERVVPDGFETNSVIDAHLNEALLRLQTCINAVKLWQINQFDPLHSSQHCIFLYYLSHTIWKRTARSDVPVRLFLLNKALHAIDCFYEVELPEVFFIGHSVGIVLAKAIYGNYLVLYQNATVGKNHGCAPTLQDGVILYPNSAIVGKCLVRQGSVISQGVSVINRDTQASSLVFQSNNGALIFKADQRAILKDFFRGV